MDDDRMTPSWRARAPQPIGDAPDALVERLYAEHRAMVRRLCRRLLRDPAEAEDAMQQTFLSAYHSLLGGTRPRQARSWLAAIARNECAARAGRRGPELVAIDEDDGAAPDAFTEVARRDDLAALRAAIGGLPQSQREAFVLRELGGLSQGQISTRLALSESSVESLLVRARRRLRERLDVALQPVRGLIPIPLIVRELVARVGSWPGSVPPAAKLTAATASVAALALTVGSTPGLRPASPPAPRTATTADEVRPGAAAAPARGALAPALAAPAEATEHAPPQAGAQEKEPGPPEAGAPSAASGAASGGADEADAAPSAGAEPSAPPPDEGGGASAAAAPATAPVLEEASSAGDAEGEGEEDRDGDDDGSSGGAPEREEEAEDGPADGEDGDGHLGDDGDGQAGAGHAPDSDDGDGQEAGQGSDTSALSEEEGSSSDGGQAPASPQPETLPEEDDEQEAPAE